MTRMKGVRRRCIRAVALLSSFTSVWKSELMGRAQLAMEEAKQITSICSSCSVR